jgi:hypothetical protein
VSIDSDFLDARAAITVVMSMPRSSEVFMGFTGSSTRLVCGLRVLWIGSRPQESREIAPQIKGDGCLLALGDDGVAVAAAIDMKRSLAVFKMYRRATLRLAMTIKK